MAPRQQQPFKVTNISHHVLIVRYNYAVYLPYSDIGATVNPEQYIKPKGRLIIIFEKDGAKAAATVKVRLEHTWSIHTVK